MNTEINNEINNTETMEVKAPAKKRVYTKKPKAVVAAPSVVSNKKVTIDEDEESDEETGKEVVLTNPDVVVDLFAELQQEYEDNLPTTTAEENLDQEDELADLLTEQLEQDLATAEDNEMEALLKQKADLDFRIQKYEQAKLVRRLATDYRALLIKNRQEKMEVLENKVKALQDEWEALEGERDAINELDDDELTSTIIGDEKLRAECGFVTKTTEPVKKVATKKKATAKKTEEPSASGAAKSAAAAKRKDEWGALPEGQQMEMTYNKAGLIYRKVGNTLVGQDGQVYKSMNDAIKKYKASKGDTKSFGSAWTLFKML